MFAKPLAPNSVARAKVIEEHIAMIEHTGSVGDAVGQDKPKPTVKIRKRKKPAPAAKAVRHRTSRR